LEPIPSVASRPELMPDDLLPRVKYYFEGRLLLCSIHDNPSLAKLTRRDA
jgi:hypothetical protein